MKAMLAAALAASALAGCAGTATPAAKQTAPLLDLSGLAWLDGDRFLAVHDAKTPEEDDLPRVSILTLPASLDGVERIDATPKFPEAPSSDLEAVATIPGTDKLLLAESGDDAGPFDRIFLAQVRGDAVEILETVRWRDFTDYYNIEAMAVAAADGGNGVLLWAERDSGKDRTRLRWARLGLGPFRIEGPAGSVSFVLPRAAATPPAGRSSTARSSLWTSTATAGSTPLRRSTRKGRQRILTMAPSAASSTASAGSRAESPNCRPSRRCSPSSTG
jgi:hypothetical protein